MHNCDEPRSPVSFAVDIAPFFAQYAEQMRWRMDLTDYDDVHANAALIYSRIKAKNDRMPPPMFSAFSDKFISDFDWWMKSGYPR